MFFASCSSSSSAIVAAGVQRPAWLSGGQSRRTGAASDEFSGAARLFRLRTKPCEIRGSLGARTPAFGAVLPALVLETNPTGPLQMTLLSVASHAAALLWRLRRLGGRGLARAVLVDRR